jgi:hypothetical protein
MFIMKGLFFLNLVFFSVTALASCEEVASEYTITDPAYRDDFIVKLKTYSAQRSNSYVFIFPPIVGETVLDKRIATSLCSQNLNAIIINAVREIPFEEEVRDLSVHDFSYTRASLSISPLIEKIQNTNPLAKFGVLGTSLGGMLAAYIAGSKPEITASVIVVGAGNVPGVLAYSDQEFVKKQRDQRMIHFNLKSAEEYESQLKSLVPNDPINFASAIPARSTYLFIATSDDTVPTKYQQELRKKIKEPLVYEMTGNHFNAIVKAGTLHSRKIVGFLKEKLN